MKRLKFVFQAEMHIIELFIRETKIVRKRYKDQLIYILSEVKEPLTAIDSFEVKSKLEWDCIKAVTITNRIAFLWDPEHSAVEALMKEHMN